MARKQTSRTEWVYLEKYFSMGSVPINVRNLTGNPVKIEFREVINDEIVLQAYECTNHSVNPYTEVWFKSIDGELVDVMSEFGDCKNGIGFTDETVDDETRKEVFLLV